MALPKKGKKFPEILADHMESEGLTGPKLAERWDIRHQRIYNWLNGANLPPRRQAEKLAIALKRPDLVEIIAQDRARARRARARLLAGAR